VNKKLIRIEKITEIPRTTLMLSFFIVRFRVRLIMFM